MIHMVCGWPFKYLFKDKYTLAKSKRPVNCDLYNNKALILKNQRFNSALIN
jgi:hypothetical protein